MRVDEHTIELAASPVWFRRAPATGTPPCYLHGLLTSADVWSPFLERTGGLAPDLIGFGRSSKAGHLDYSLEGLAEFVERLLDEVHIAQAHLVGHGWGAAVALELAARAPERVERLVLIDPVALIDGFHWDRLARALRRPLLGELVLGSILRPLLDRHLRKGAATPGAWTREQLDTVWEHFDQGTQRAVLLLHRRTATDHLSALADRLVARSEPALVLYGERDPWLEPEPVHALARLLPEATVAPVPDAGHWPWLDRPDTVEQVAAFLRTERL